MVAYINVNSNTMPTVKMKVSGSELVIGKVCFVARFIADSDSAIELLMEGEIVHVKQDGPLVTDVQRRMADLLSERGERWKS